MLKKFLKEVISIIAGKQSEEIVDLLDTKKYVNEFIIAKKLDLTINQTRNILYKISDHGIVSSIRKKDKKKGWYTYFWKIEVLRSLEFLKESLTKKIIQLKNQIRSRETKRFYICELCHIELTEENALLHDFTCNECGRLLVLKDNAKILREMRRNLDKLNKDFELVQQEINSEMGKSEKQKLKEKKKEDKINQLKKKKKKAENKKKKLEKLAKNKIPHAKKLLKKIILKKYSKKKAKKPSKHPKKKFFKKTKKSRR